MVGVGSRYRCLGCANDPIVSTKLDHIKVGHWQVLRETGTRSNLNIGENSYYTMLNVRRKTTTVAKRGQIVALASLEGARRMRLAEISANTGVTISTCSNIISESRRRSQENGIVDLCSDENLAPKPNAERGCNAVITREEKEALIALTLSDYRHCRMTFAQLAREGTCRQCTGDPQMFDYN
jgi:hypothetical protein